MSLILVFILAALPMNVIADDAAKLLKEASAAFDAGKFADAAKLAEKAAKADPKNAKAPYIAGASYLRLRDNPAAIKAFTEVLDRDPKLAAAHDRRGDAYLKSGQWKKAIADFDAFLKANPEFARNTGGAASPFTTPAASTTAASNSISTAPSIPRMSRTPPGTISAMPARTRRRRPART